VEVDSPKINNYTIIQENYKNNLSLAAKNVRTIEPKRKVLSQVNNSVVEDYERAISYNIMNAHKTIQEVEKDCEKKLVDEKRKYREKEKENRVKLKEITY